MVETLSVSVVSCWSHFVSLFWLVFGFLWTCLDFLTSIIPCQSSGLITLGLCLVSFAEGTTGDPVFDGAWTSRLQQGWNDPVRSMSVCSVGVMSLDCGCPALCAPCTSGPTWYPDKHFQNRLHLSSSHVWLRKKFLRVGEASNPGPPLAISCINPSGMAGKVTQALDLPRGIINVSESHLSAVSMPPTLQQFRRQASDSNRQLWISPGAAVPLRPRSDFTGVWSGVLQLSDVRCHPLSLHWENDEHSLGRVHVSKFYCGETSVVGAVLYGWAPSPSWPSARKATAAILSQLTREVVLGLQGPRFICGDMNGEDVHFSEFAIWESLGWVDCRSCSKVDPKQHPCPLIEGKLGLIACTSHLNWQSTLNLQLCSLPLLIMTP